MYLCRLKNTFANKEKPATQENLSIVVTFNITRYLSAYLYL